MSYENEHDAKEELQEGTTDTLTYWAKVDGAPVSIDADTAFVTVLDPNGTELYPRQAATIGTGGKLTVSIALGTKPIDEDYISVWEWQVSGASFADRMTFDVVKTKLPCAIDTSDLEEHYPNIREHLKALKESDASKFARRAWSLMLDRIRAGGHRPSLVMDRKRLINPAVQLMAALTTNALAKTPGDLWDARAGKHMRNYEALFSGLGSLKYDRDEEGTANGPPARLNRIRGWV